MQGHLSSIRALAVVDQSTSLLCEPHALCSQCKCLLQQSVNPRGAYQQSVDTSSHCIVSNFSEIPNVFRRQNEYLPHVETKQNTDVYLGTCQYSLSRLSTDFPATPRLDDGLSVSVNSEDENSDNITSLNIQTTVLGDQNSGCEHCQTKIIFSAGGRAQIQAWKVSLITRKRHLSQIIESNEYLAANDSSVLDQRQTLCEKGISKEESDLGNIFPQVTYHYGLNSNLENQQNLLDLKYEHLGGCFLGEARHKRSMKPWKTRYLKLDPETRIMSLVSMAANAMNRKLLPGMYILAAAGSDGVLR